MPILPRCLNISVFPDCQIIFSNQIIYFTYHSPLGSNITLLSFLVIIKKISDHTVKRKVGQQCNRRLLYQHIFYSDTHKKLRFFHNLNQFVKNIVQKLHKIFKISSETQMFRSNLNNSFLYMFRLFAQYLLLRININETYIVLSN